MAMAGAGGLALGAGAVFAAEHAGHLGARPRHDLQQVKEVETKRRHEGCTPIAARLFCPEATLLSLQRVPSMMSGASRETPRMALKSSWRISFEDAPSPQESSLRSRKQRQNAMDIASCYGGAQIGAVQTSFLLLRASVGKFFCTVRPVAIGSW